MAQKHIISDTEYPMTRDGRIQGPSRRYRRLRHPIFPAATWTAKNPLLQRGEIGAESDTYRMKIGDGVTYWNDLPYSSNSIATWGDIQGDIADQTDLQNALDAKQDVLTAGSNIQIDSDNVISATDTTYTASDGVTLTGTNFTNSGVRSVASGTANGTISVNTNGTSADVAVTGLGSAAYTASTAYDVAGAASTAETNAKNYADGLASNYATAAQGAKADTAVQPGDLATVATTGSYNDLLNKPTIPAAQVNSDWDAVSGVAQILNKPSLATVATSGDYDDLLNKPTIPTVNNATLTIQKNGTTVNTFTANASSNVTANITVPTKISDLTNDSNFANTDLSNLTSTGKNIGNWSTNATNCITEIPQDIKLDLANGTLTLKSGSKLHMADGNLETTTTTSADITRTSPYNGQYMLILYGGSIFNGFVDSCLSGTIANRPNSTAHNVGMYFATDENKIYITNDAGATWVHAANMSMPFAIITVSGGAISSIDQIFNGFGYIGSTMFVLPGVKAIYPNGKNADGTLKSSSFSISSVNTLDAGTGTDTNDVRLRDTGLQQGVIYYLDDFNYNSITPNYTRENIRAVVKIGSVSYVSGKITSFSVKNVFNALDFNDSSYIANCAMPSDKHIDLTLGTSGTVYTAPADGYYTITKQAGASNEYIYLNNYSKGMNSGVMATSALNCRCFIPVSKGDYVIINYTLTGTTSMFRFVFANGAK